MKWRFSLSLVSLIYGVQGAYAVFASVFKPLPPPFVTNAAPSNYTGQGTFAQPIDHSNPQLGTFNQRFWYNATHWGGPGYPVKMLLKTPFDLP
jgi:hypothetical protein